MMPTSQTKARAFAVCDHADNGSRRSVPGKIARGAINHCSLNGQSA